jgi:hypothetical protein
MNYTLAIIDMQHTFPASRIKRIRNNVAKEIRMAMKESAAIVFVEYLGCTPTYPELVSLTDKYESVQFVGKLQDDGSDEVFDCLKEFKYPTKHIRVCGVNTDQCVYGTVVGLAQRLPSSTLEVVSRSCNGYIDHKGGLKNLSTISNVFIS